MDNKPSDTTFMPQRQHILRSGIPNDREDASSANALQGFPTRTHTTEMNSMTIIESLPDERTIKLSPDSIQETIELMKPVKVAIVIPTLNEELAVGKVIDEIHSTLDNYKLTVSDAMNTVLVGLKPWIVVVDGGSTDNTAKIAKSRRAVVLRQRGRGYGDALVVGFGYAIEAFDPDVLVMMDADGTYDAADIPRILLSILSDEADIVLGNRFSGMQPGAMTFTNRIGNRAISWLANRLLGVGVSDTQCGLRALAPDVAKLFNGYANGMSFATEMLADAEHAGARIIEVSIVYRPRIGRPKLDPLHDGARIAGIILRLLRDYRPLLFFGGAGAALALLGILFGLNTVKTWLYTGAVASMPSALLTILLIAAGLQLASLGLLADMIRSQRPNRRLPPTPPRTVPMK